MVAITRRELGAGELRREAARCRDARAARRMLALALVLEGGSRETAARAAGMDRQTLARLGPPLQRGGPRRPARPASTGAQATAHARAGGGAGGRRGAGAGPGPRRRGALAPGRPAGADRGPLRGPAARAHGRQGPAPARLQPRLGQAAAPEGGRGGAGGVQKGFAELVREALPEHARGKPVEVWFLDEARVGQQGTLTRVWARRGTRPRAPRDRRHTWAYLFGAVCPERAVGAALVLPYADTEATGLHLAEIGRAVAPGAHAVVVLDRAGWHGAGDLAVPENLTLLPLPVLRARVEPGRERLGVPAPEQAQPSRLGELRRHRRDLLRGVELARGGARPARLDHPPRVGESGHQLGPLV